MGGSQSSPKFVLSMCLFGYASLQPLVNGLYYLFHRDMLPLHAAIIDHKQLPESTQLLYFSLTNMVGAGSVVTGCSLFTFLLIPFREQLPWARYAITALAAAYYVPAFLVIARIRLKSNVRPAISSLVIGLGCVVGGYLLSDEMDGFSDSVYAYTWSSY